MLGGRLATRQAALREVMAAGSRLLLLVSCLPFLCIALFVPQKTFSGRKSGLELYLEFTREMAQRQAMAEKRGESPFFILV